MPSSFDYGFSGVFPYSSTPKKINHNQKKNKAARKARRITRSR